jgi:hypothetical protein
MAHVDPDHHLYISAGESGERTIVLRCCACTYRWFAYFPYEIPEWWPQLLELVISHIDGRDIVPSESVSGG